MNVQVAHSYPCPRSIDVDFNQNDTSSLAFEDIDFITDTSSSFVCHRSSIKVYKEKRVDLPVVKDTVDESIHTTATASTTGSYQSQPFSEPLSELLSEPSSEPLSEPLLKKRVSFGSLTIHEHNLELGGSGVPRSGPALSLGWGRDSVTKIENVLDYENSRICVPRKGIEMVLPRKERVNMMLESGYTFNQIKKASEELDTLRKQRVKTIVQVSMRARTISTLKKFAVWKKSE